MVMRCGNRGLRYLCCALDVLRVAGDEAGLVLVVGGHIVGGSSMW
jgi:hypothetical protein